MGARMSCFQGENGSSKDYLKLGTVVPNDDHVRKAVQSQAVVMYDLESSRLVEDHAAVRRALSYVPGWVEQTPLDGFLEYWFFFSNDDQRKYPAAKARLPWPIFHATSAETLQAFVHVVNRVAHRTILTTMSDTRRDSRHQAKEAKIIQKIEEVRWSGVPSTIL
ncbi:hypothetical protein MPTK1_8g11055 [Marchantia polymorpha subsp. ruderalis]